VTVEGDPIYFGSSVMDDANATIEGSRDTSGQKDSVARKDGQRNRNLIDADETFIREIEKYIMGKLNIN
jgi:hypothetical protein